MRGSDQWRTLTHRVSASASLAAASDLLSRRLSSSPAMRACSSLFLLLALLALLVLPTRGLYFYVVEGGRKCFIEEVPEDVLVVGRYTSHDHSKLNLTPQGVVDGKNFAAIRATVTDPRNELLLTHDLAADGKFGFTSVVGGEHLICLATNTSSWYGQARSFKLSLQLDIGDAAQDYSEIAKSEHLSAIEVEIRKLNDKIRHIRAEQEYQRVNSTQRARTCSGLRVGGAGRFNAIG